MIKRVKCNTLYPLYLFGGGGWIRTIEAVRQQIYSLSHLTALELLQIWSLAVKSKAPFHHCLLELAIGLEPTTC